MREARRYCGPVLRGPPRSDPALAFPAVVVGALLACRPAGPPAETEDAGAAASSGVGALLAAPRCASSGAGTFTFGESGAVGSLEEDGGDVAPSLPLPFAVEVGSAVSTGAGFAVAALRSQHGGTSALVALVGAEVSGGRIVELGRIHGDVGPPAIAARGDRLFAVVPDGDPAGVRLRLAELRDGGVIWRGEVAQSFDDSHAFGVALGDERGVVAWDELLGTPRSSVIRVATFTSAAPGSLTRARSLTLEGEDAEGPRVVAREGGFWIAWVRSAAARGSDRAALRPAAPPAASVDRAPDPPALALGRRALVLSPLDASGSLAGTPRELSLEGAHVLAFDLVALADGSALVAWRDDAAGPGIEARTVHLARVSAGGDLTRALVEDERVGAGVPTLLVDAAPTAEAPLAWLSLVGLGDEAELVALAAPLQPADSLGAEAALRGGEPLAARGGRFLVGRPHGLAMELFSVACRPGPRAEDAGAP